MTELTRHHVARHEIAHALGAAASASGIRFIRILPASGKPFRDGFGRDANGKRNTASGVFEECRTRVGSNDRAFMSLCGWAWETLYGNEAWAADDLRQAEKRIEKPVSLAELKGKALEFVRLHAEVIEEAGDWVDRDLADADGKIGKRKMDALYQHLRQRIKPPYSRSGWRQYLAPGQ